ncbi:MAG: class I SAM-dependent methyltransferase, partial [Chitinivibrionales bacterium]|nr:class I SAM-dependent methyltransferase [Chitinivibrionales bacterium]
RGEIVELLRKDAIPAFGADVFYSGEDHLDHLVNKEWLKNGIIKKIENNRIDFEDNYFDCVIANQVLEHVEDIDSVLTEIKRVLKPNGLFFCLVPTKDTWYEVHSGIPFLHWFSTTSSLRYCYAYCLRLLGFGLHKGDKTSHKWVNGYLDYLDNYTCFRTEKEIRAFINKYFKNQKDYEPDYLNFKLANSKLAISSGAVFFPFFRLLAKLFVKKYAGLVFSATK